MLTGTNTKRAQVASWVDKEKKAAERLKTPAELKRDKAKKAKEMAERQQWKQESEKAEKEKEAKKLAERQQREFEQTDYYKIRTKITSKFEEWQTKGEFEKQSDYEERLTSKSQEIFDEICIEQIQEQIQDHTSKMWYNRISYNSADEAYTSDYGAGDLSSYNSEDETFLVKFKIGNYDEKLPWQTKVNVPLADAEKFKDSWKKRTVKNSNFEWVFVENNLFPSLIILTDIKNNNSEYRLNLPLANQKEITFSFDDFGINNSHLKGYVCSYSKEQQAAEDAEQREAKQREEEERQAQEKERQAAAEAKQREEELNRIYYAHNRMDVQPSFPGGDDKFSPWTETQLVYPAEATPNGGVVNLRFVVERDGSIGDVVVLTAPDASLEKEAIRIIKKMPRWSPGEMGGQPVRTWVDKVLRFRPQRASSY
ncbi:TonB protein [Candidatus Symbiothrix dinenymphae]|nr:TonB protein [Candidatus Symbiothrix dinenymphae]